MTRENNLYIPENLLIFRRPDTKKSGGKRGEFAQLGYIIGDEVVFGGREENYTLQSYGVKSKVLAGLSQIKRGIIPKDLEGILEIVPNTSFSPEIRECTIEEDGYLDISENDITISLWDPIREISFAYNLDNRDYYRILLRLGIDKGRIIKDAVIGFKYSISFDVYNPKLYSYPSYVYLISQTDPEYKIAAKESEWIRDYWESTPQPALKVGSYYRKKGYITRTKYNYYNYEQSEKRIVVYLGDKWKVANGEHRRPPFKPGEKYRRFPMFMEISYMTPDGKGSYFPSPQANICSFPLDNILCEIPTINPLPQYEIDNIKERFESSPYSHKFWNTPGIVKKMAMFEKSEEDDPGRFREVRIYPQTALMNGDSFTSINTIKKINSNDDTSSIPYWEVTSDYHFTPVTLSIDHDTPLKITPVDQSLKAWIGDSEWAERGKSSTLPKDILDKYALGSGIKYYTSDGRFIFKEVVTFLNHASISLAITGMGDYRTWRIADPSPSEILNLTSLRMKGK